MKKFFVLFDKKVVLHSPLSRVECAARLNGEMDSGWSTSGTRRIIGHASPSNLSARVRITYRNSFQTVLRATLQDDGSGTTFACSFGMTTFARLFMGMWFCLVSLSSAVDILAYISSRSGAVSNDASFNPTSLTFSIVMLLRGFGVAILGRWLARNEQEELTEFVSTTTNATERSSPIVS